MTEAFVGLGSNLGDGQRNLLAAWTRLGETAGVTLAELSSPYRTEPVGMDSPHWFTNAVGRLRTGLAPQELLAIMLKIETDMGRVRDRAATQPVDRPVDLDLLYYGDLVSDDPGLILPHPEIENRLFVLAPLVELAPEFRHPVLGLSSVAMLARLTAADCCQHIEKSAWDYREVEEKRG